MILLGLIFVLKVQAAICVSGVMAAVIGYGVFTAAERMAGAA